MLQALRQLAGWLACRPASQLDSWPAGILAAWATGQAASWLASQQASWQTFKSTRQGNPTDTQSMLFEPALTYTAQKNASRADGRIGCNDA